MQARYPELDVLRTLAIVGMVIYHAAYDLVVFYEWDIDIYSGWWNVFQSSIAITFLLLVGVNFAISHHRTKRELVWRKFLKRGLIVFGCGMLVSIATYIVDPVTYVRFGILHLIGVSLILLPFFADRKIKKTIFVILVVFVIFAVSNIPITGTTFLIPFGFPPASFQTVDYFPLFPWFSIVLIGLIIGRQFYVTHTTWRPNILDSNFHILTIPSRYSLLIYLIHQPMLLGVLWIVKRVSW